MNKIKSKLLILFVLLSVFIESNAYSETCHHHCKTKLGDTFDYFDLVDTYNQRWISSYLRDKPVIILTGHRNQKYEIAKWAECLRQEFQDTGLAHVLWVVNLRKISWNTSRETVVRQWRTFNTSVPVLLDWDGVIGHNLKINYNIPNIIVLDSCGKLVMHEMHTYSPEVYSVISDKIKPACFICNIPHTKIKLSKGCCGDSY